jgi:hypothetical protein
MQVASLFDAVSSRMVSRRRFVGNQFMELQKFVSKRVAMDDDHHLVVDPTAVKQLQNDLYQRMQLLLPVAAAVMAADPIYKQGEPWRLPCCMWHVTCGAQNGTGSASRRPVQGLEGRTIYDILCTRLPRGSGTRPTCPLASLGAFKSCKKNHPSMTF